jgi:hypothetical protein
MLLAAGGLALLSSRVQASPEQWTTGSGGNGNSFYFVAAPGISWSAASADANAMGGYLATLTSAAENTWVYNNIISPALGSGHGGTPETEAWVGGYNDGSNSTSGNPTVGWHWVTGEAWSYTNWNPAEPNNVGGVEDGLALNRYGDATWNDEGSWPDGIGGYVVEINSVPDTGSTAALLGMSVLAFGLIKRRTI